MIEIKDNCIKISVRNLVEFILRQGNIDNRKASLVPKDAMLEGGKIHRKIQKSMGSNYASEVSLKYEIDNGNYSIIIEGRADGIISEDNNVVIDEIKGVYMDLTFLGEPVPVHKAQAMCYGYIVATKKELSNIAIQMTYCNIDTEEIKRFKEEYSYDSIRNWFDELIASFTRWTDFLYEHSISRDCSISGLQFPFQYREGQREVATSVYKTILRKKNLFIQAPTGIGKTVSTVFPAVKAIGEKIAGKIFYLTAKTITRTVAEETFDLIRERGADISTVTITAKDKLCICEERECNPDNCPYADGHYDRINDAIYDIVSMERSITREVIVKYSNVHKVCPFELCLDISDWVDTIICDYNYVFDPNVYLKRYFSPGITGEYVFLVDEAHNLVERAREMNSASLYKEDILELKKLIKPYSKKIAGALDRCNKILLEYKKECEDYLLLDNAGSFYLALSKVAIEMDKFFENNQDKEDIKDILDFYFQIKNYIDVYEKLDKNYVIYVENEEINSFKIKLLCVDPSKNIGECIEKGRSAIFFSATFLPITYYKKLLHNDEEDYAIYIPSPFEQAKRLLMVANDVSSKYTRRNKREYERIVEYIISNISQHTGNYLVYFPSYKMMDEIYGMLLEEKTDDMEVLLQTQGMTERQREEFLESFSMSNNQTLIGLCTMGGIFSEGIDLTNDRLIGTIIIGTGLPMVCNEREILKGFFDERMENGFDYAYRFPGINKVLQAAGRVIRTQNDVGTILLLDERLLTNSYRNLFPVEWNDYKIVNCKEVKKQVSEFWEKRGV